MDFVNISSLSEVKIQWAMDVAGYEDFSISLQLFEEWWTASPQSVWQLKNGATTIAAIGVWSIKPEILKKLIAEEITEHQIRGEDLIPINNLPNYSLLYLSGVVVHPEHRHQGYAVDISLRLLSWLKANNSNKKIKIYTWPTNQSAQRITEKLNFAPIPDSNFYVRDL